MTNSSLVTYEKVCSNKTVLTNKQNLYIIPHCYVGQVTAKQGCDAFYKRTNASCQYVVGCDGSIGLCVDEKDRSWCTGGDKKVYTNTGTYTGRDMDFLSVTIEVASDTTAPYVVTTKAYEALVNLMADIAKRNNMGELKWKADAKLTGQPDKQNVLAHRWYATKSCPGDFLYNRMGEICALANEVNKTGIPYKSPAPKMEAAKPTIKNGSKGENAKLLQANLNMLGYKDNSGTALVEDGIIGARSIQALKQFQKEKGLNADGIYGNMSYNAMIEALY